MLRARFNQDSFHPHSLGVRVMLSAFFVLALFTLTIIAILDHANKNKVIDKYEQQLELQVYNLLAISEFENNEIQISSFFNDKRLNQKNGDLIAIIYNENHERLWDSFSAKTVKLRHALDGELGKAVSSIIESSENEQYLAKSLKIIFDDKNNAQQLTFFVALKTSSYKDEISNYREKLLLGGSITILVILLLQGIILFFGFQSLNKITEDLKGIVEGKKSSLDGRYPRELQSVSQAINTLISNERSQKERYQKSLADLAHSLKTPLSVLQSYSERLENKNIFTEQIERIDQIISYQLQRASHSGIALSSVPVEVKPIVKEINKALEKVYQHKNISLALQIPDECYFHGDKNDLMELLGNLMDNAYKHSQEKIFIKATFSKDKKNRLLEIFIEDDGAGVAEQDKDFILQRGARTDSLNPGQGIGLAVVVDIVSAYNGNISIDKSELGGAQFKVSFLYKLI